MITLTNNKTIYFDVDDTLALTDTENYLPEECVTINVIGNPNYTDRVVPHKAHIEYLKLRKREGYAIIIWSAAGWERAQAVVEALGLDDYVDLVLAKSMEYVDDLRVEEFMCHRIYIKDDK